MSLEIGDIFASRYRVDGRLGSGGFGDVYRVTDMSSGQVVALKILTANDPQARARFAREVEIVARLQSPHTVGVLGSGVHEGVHYAAFEYIEGRDLDEVLSEGRLDPLVVEHILRQLLASLEEAHAQQLLHRDIKPANIRVFRAGEDPWCVKLLDFGIARATDGGHPNLTKTGELIGTPRYMSPEQLTEKPLTPASDIYSLGMVAFEMLAGSESLQGGSWGEQLDRLHTDYLPNLSAFAPSSALGRVVLAMLQRDAAKRPRSARQVLAMLDGQRTTSAAPKLEPSGDPVAKRIALGGVVVVILVILVGLVWFATRDEEKTSSTRAPATQRANPLAERPPEVPEKEPAVEAVEEKVQETIEGSLSGCSESPPFVGGGQLPGPLVTNGWSGYVPRSYDPGRAHPLVMLLHDDAQQGADLLQGAGVRELADQRGFVVVAPSSDFMNAWESDEADKRLLDIVAETAEVLCIDEARVFAVGQGTGGHKARQILCKDGIRAAATNNYSLRGGLDRCPRKPLITIHATQSVYYPAGGGRNCRDTERRSVAELNETWRPIQGCAGEARSWFAGPHGSCKTWTCEQDYVSCVVQGGGAWPGTKDGRLNPKCRPKPPTMFRTTERVWSFFESLDERGCGVAPPFRGEGELSSSGAKPWAAYIPERAGSTPMPMLMLLHQSEGGPLRFMRGSGFVELAERHGLILVAPHGGVDAWKGKGHAEYLNLVAQSTTEQLCVDRTRQYVVGHGQGGRAVELLSCASWVDGIATNSHRSSRASHDCDRPIPHITLAGLKTDHEPVEGGENCLGFPKLSLSDWERKWTNRNHCDDRRIEVSRPGGSRCYGFDDCKEPVMSCHLDGGHGWPGFPPRVTDQLPGPQQGCDGEPPSFPTAITIWKFFDSLAD